MLFIGVIYAWSILKAPLASEFNWSISGLALNFTLTLWFFCIGGVLGSMLTANTSERVTILAAAAMLLLGFVICSQMSGNTIGVLYFAYGGLCGTGIGMSCNAIVSICNAWFSDKKGTSTGVLMMCFGISSLLLGHFSSLLIENPAFGWRTTYLLLGIAIAAVLIPIGLILKRPTQQVISQKNMAIDNKSESSRNQHYAPGEMIRRKSFCMFYFYGILTCAVGSTVISFARDLALSIGAETALATTLVGVLSLCNGLGRFLFGLIFDKLGGRKTMLLANAITIVAPAIILFSILAKSLPSCVVGFCLTGIAYGGSPTISAAMIGELYGMNYFPKNYSIINTIVIPASITSTVAGVILEATGGAYVPIFIMLLIFPIIALTLSLRIREP